MPDGKARLRLRLELMARCGVYAGRTTWMGMDGPSLAGNFLVMSDYFTIRMGKTFSIVSKASSLTQAQASF